MLYKLYHLISENLWLFGLILLVFIGLQSTQKRKKHHQKAKKKLKDVIASNMNEPLTLHPEIDANLCGGCGACVNACPEGDILQLINHRAVLVDPTKCVGHGECEASCPFNAIHLVFGTKTRGMDLPRVNGNYETNVPGLYIAGELGGMGLIRNAVKQGKLAAEHAAKNLNKGQKADVDVLVIGAGPAGIAAALSCAGAKTRYLCIEQNKFGGTIYNFPRQKVVMSQPVDFPVIGETKFPKNKVSKEELLGFWHGIRKKSGLRIKENTKFINLCKKNSLFSVETNKGNITAQKVILAMGVRGTPRKLNVPGEESTKVTYNLIEPEQYQRKWIAVVGGGNAGVEAAQYLAKLQYRNKVFLLVRSEKLDRCNEENQKIIFDYERQRRVKICFNTFVEEVHKEYLIVNVDGKRRQLQNDFLFIFAGALLPFDFLKSLGIMIDKKFGERLKAG